MEHARHCSRVSSAHGCHPSPEGRKGGGGGGEEERRGEEGRRGEEEGEEDRREEEGREDCYSSITVGVVHLMTFILLTCPK